MTDLRVIAIVGTYNERRFIGGCIEHLIRQGVSVYVIDNESTDGTLEIVERYVGRGVIGVEQLPRDGSVDYRPQYLRKQELAMSLDGDWFIHVDADEVHETPDRRTTLLDVFTEADDLGFNAVNFIEFTFLPTVEAPNHDHPEFEQTMRWYYPYIRDYPHRLNAWKRQDQLVDLLSTDGHRVAFPGLRLFPRNLYMRHYQFLSVEHAVEKYARQVHAGRVHRLQGKNWTIGFHPDRLVIPNADTLRHWVPGEPLDRSEPEPYPLWVRTDWRTLN